MPDKVKLLLIPYPKTEKHEIYNEIVKCLFEESFPSIETDIFLKYAKSQRDLRQKLEGKHPNCKVFLSYKNSKDCQ